MENNRGIEEITRREALKIGTRSALAGLSLLLVGSQALAESPKDRLKRYKKQFFGWWPFLKDGDLEKLDYKHYKKDKKKFQTTVTEAVRFVNGEKKSLYHQVYRRRWEKEWNKDRNKVCLYLIKNLNVPDYFTHRTIRDVLKKEGILDFEHLKESVEKSLDDLIQKYNDSSNPLYRGPLKKIASQIVERSSALRKLYLATLPVYNEKALEKIEKQREKIIKKTPDLIENVLNIQEAEKSGSYLKLTHQTKELILGFNDLYSNDLPAILEIALQYGKVQAGLGHRYKKLFPDPSSEKFIYVPDYIEREYSKLNFLQWEKNLKKKISQMK